MPRRNPHVEYTRICILDAVNITVIYPFGVFEFRQVERVLLSLAFHAIRVFNLQYFFFSAVTGAMGSH